MHCWSRARLLAHRGTSAPQLLTCWRARRSSLDMPMQRDLRNPPVSSSLGRPLVTMRRNRPSQDCAYRSRQSAWDFVLGGLVGAAHSALDTARMGWMPLSRNNSFFLSTNRLAHTAGISALSGVNFRRPMNTGLTNVSSVPEVRSPPVVKTRGVAVVAGTVVRTIEVSVAVDPFCHRPPNRRPRAIAVLVTDDLNIFYERLRPCLRNKGQRLRPRH